MTELTLPAFAMLETKELEGRNVVLHVRSASVIEIFRADLAFINEGILSQKFFIDEVAYIAVLHYCATLNQELDRELIRKEILKPAAKWWDEQK